MAQRGGRQRVKLSWQEALGPQAPAPSQDKKPKAKAKPKRKKRHPNDVRTEQDMDAIAGFDDSSGDELDAEVDTFGGAGFVLVDLESEMEELVATEEGASPACAWAPSTRKAITITVILIRRRKEREEDGAGGEGCRIQEGEEEGEKMRQALKLLEVLEEEEKKEEEEVVVVVEQSKKQKKKSKRIRRTSKLLLVLLPEEESREECQEGGEDGR
ncbi:DIS3-like exonuclease 2 [Phytophthora cinnamomi]|uniref:DIS3-like exonuclease 2 n=1 Tax=Phytophthora cinnamomi TaxID=4785 RepID=UPI003559DACB|nr:DIS3-like exonuclease 2 [Phytophthora cinnamomi]